MEPTVVTTEMPVHELINELSLELRMIKLPWGKVVGGDNMVAIEKTIVELMKLLETILEAEMVYLVPPDTIYEQTIPAIEFVP